MACLNCNISLVTSTYSEKNNDTCIYFLLNRKFYVTPEIISPN